MYDTIPDSGLHTQMTAVPVIAPPALARPHVLQPVSGPLLPMLIELREEVLIVGRATETDIRIPSSTLSRQHMRLERRYDGYRAVDLDSANGVHLNGIRIHSAVLRDGDVLQLGDAVFMYHEGR